MIWRIESGAMVVRFHGCSVTSLFDRVFTYFGEEITRNINYYSHMPPDTSELESLTAEQKEIIAFVRERLQPLHNIDTSTLDDMEIMMRLAVVTEITKSKKSNRCGHFGVVGPTAY